MRNVFLETKIKSQQTGSMRVPMRVTHVRVSRRFRRRLAIEIPRRNESVGRFVRWFVGFFFLPSFSLP